MSSFGQDVIIPIGRLRLSRWKRASYHNQTSKSTGYPEPADIKYYRLEKQDMSWKREIKANVEWR